MAEDKKESGKPMVWQHQVVKKPENEWGRFADPWGLPNGSYRSDSKGKIFEILSQEEASEAIQR